MDSHPNDEESRSRGTKLVSRTYSVGKPTFLSAAFSAIVSQKSFVRHPVGSRLWDSTVQEWDKTFLEIYTSFSQKLYKFYFYCKSSSNYYRRCIFLKSYTSILENFRQLPPPNPRPQRWPSRRALRRDIGGGVFGSSPDVAPKRQPGWEGVKRYDVFFASQKR